MEPLWQWRSTRHRRFQAIDATARGAAEMDVPGVVNVGCGNNVAKYSARIGGLMRETVFGEPVQYAV